jgi:hypothetical protein
MSLKDCCFDGSRTLKIKDLSTDVGSEKSKKQELVAQTAENITRAAILQEKLYAELLEAAGLGGPYHYLEEESGRVV